MNMLKDVPAGTAEEMNVIIEIPKGSKNKYEIDKETGLIMLDRVHHSTQDTPYDYGFVPQTLWEDGDPLDVVILSTHPFFPGLLVKVRPVAVLRMNDCGDSDAKIIALPVSDKRWEHVQDVGDINKHTLKEIEHYFTTYKLIEQKVVTTDGFGDKQEAMKDFEQAIIAYKEKNK